MKKIFLICLISLVIAAGLLWRAFTKPSRYGTFSAAPQADVASLINQPGQFLGKTIQIEGTISEQCKTMGCYFFFRSGKQELRVDLQDIAMRAPRHEGGKARVEGQLVPYNGAYQFTASAVQFE